MISVDKVYKTVLYILNKEQRGYVTPAEFNHIAEVEQNAIFWSYMKEGAQVQQLKQANMQSDVPLFDLTQDIEQKLSPFITTEGAWQNNFMPNTGLYPRPDNVNIAWYTDVQSDIPLPVRILNVIARYTSSTGGSTVESECDFITLNEYEKVKRSKLTKPDKRNPVFMTREAGNFPLDTYDIAVSPAASSISCNVLRQPTVPKWNFTVGTQNQYIYSPTGSNDFQLDSSEESRLINNILLKFGVVVRDPGVIQVAMAEQQRESQEK